MIGNYLLVFCSCKGCSKGGHGQHRSNVRTRIRRGNSVNPRPLCLHRLCAGPSPVIHTWMCILPEQTMERSDALPSNLAHSQCCQGQCLVWWQMTGDTKSHSRGSEGTPKMKEAIKMQSQEELKYSLSPTDESLLESAFHRGGCQTMGEIVKIRH